jgi:hypothetical protein
LLVRKLAHRTLWRSGFVRALLRVFSSAGQRFSPGRIAASQEQSDGQETN